METLSDKQVAEIVVNEGLGYAVNTDKKMIDWIFENFGGSYTKDKH